jgi:hypothetical protein
MAVIPAPVLPKAKTYKHPKLVRIGFSLAYGLLPTVCAFLMMHFLVLVPPNYGLYLGLGSFFLILGGILAYQMDFSSPTVTIEEMWFRRRLEEACRRDQKVEQLNADYKILEASITDLRANLSSEDYEKLKDADVVDHAIELARAK